MKICFKGDLCFGKRRNIFLLVCLDDFVVKKKKIFIFEKIFNSLICKGISLWLLESLKRNLNLYSCLFLFMGLKFIFFSFVSILEDSKKKCFVG